jgi:ADP-heptose:LPS heptosyltransferase
MFKKMKSRLPAWRGQRIKGKTIYVQREQGLGDAIQFIRYLDMLKDQKVRIVLECPNQLFRLLKDSPIIDQLVRERKKRINNPPVKCDYAVFLLSLPGIFKTELNTIPKQLPYLVADPTLIKKWQAKLSKDSRLKIGIVWGGNPRHSNDFNRSCSLELFLKYLSHPQVALYSLQKGIYAEQLATVKLGEVIDLGKKVTDLADTAAIIMNLDLVISVDTAVAHLAGALAQPVWVLLPYVPDWRWLLDRSDSPWYPTMRLFRQSAKMDWAEVLKSIKGELVKRFF